MPGLSSETYVRPACWAASFGSTTASAGLRSRAIPYLPAAQHVTICSATEFRLVVGSCARRGRLARLPPMTQLCLARVRLRFVVEGRALDIATEAALKAD